MKDGGLYWQDFPAQGEKSLLEKINALSALALFDEQNTALKIADLSFYTNFKLVQATTFTSLPPVTMHYLVGGESPNWTVIRLDGTSKPIFANNKQAGLNLNEKTVVAYALFVLGCVMSEEGSLRLVEAVDEDMFTDSPTPAQLEELARLVRPAKIKRTDGGFALDVIVLYGANVFRLDLEVRESGFLEIRHEEELAKNMPIRPIFLE
jgi:hypothetical protein